MLFVFDLGILVRSPAAEACDIIDKVFLIVNARRQFSKTLLRRALSLRLSLERCNCKSITQQQLLAQNGISLQMDSQTSVTFSDDVLQGIDGLRS
jgi:hypothetical protein